MPISPYLRNLRQKIGTELIMMPAVSGVVFNAAGEVLVQRAADDGNWYVPGGALDPGEDPADAVVREMAEETGLVVVPEWLLGVYVDPVVTYSNGDRVAYTSTTFVCGTVRGEARVGDDESLELRYFAPDALPDMLATHRLRIEHARAGLAGDRRARYRSSGEWPP